MFEALGCTAHRAPSADYGIPRCSESAWSSLLSVEALQCWFDAPHGRWRRLSHESHYAVLVVNVEAADLSDAGAIAQRFVEEEHAAFTEILVYVKRQPPAVNDTMRRVRWTPDAGFDSLDFSAIDR